MVLKAILENNLGEVEKAKRSLREAVSIAALQNFRRSFLDEGEQVFKLLPSIKDHSPKFVSQLMDDFRLELKLDEEVLPSNTNSMLREPLSEREIEVGGL